MKYLKQFSWIMAVTCVGEFLKYVLPLPIPASVYGLCIMLLLLVYKIIKLENVAETGCFLIEIMPLMFIPATVGLVVAWPQLKSMLLPVLVITVISTICVMIVSGKVTQLVIDREKNNE